MKRFVKFFMLALSAVCVSANAELIMLPDGTGNTGNYSVSNDFDEAYSDDLYVVGKVTFTNFNSVDCWNVVTFWDSTGGELYSCVQLGNGVNWGMVTAGTGEATSDYPIVDGEQTLIVVKMQQEGKVLKMWVNPDLSQPETEPDVQQTSTRSDFSLGGVYYRGGYWGGNPNESTIDYEDFMVFVNESPFNSHNAVNPTPGVGVEMVDLTTDLSWNAPLEGALPTYDVYISNVEPNDLIPNYSMDLVAEDLTVETLSNSALVSAFGELENGTTYYWRVDCSEPNSPGAPIYHEGTVWNFTTIPATVLIPNDPENFTAAIGGEAVFTVGDLNGQNYQWYYSSLDGSVTGKVLNESAKYQNVNTAELTITDAAIADEGYYYCEVSNILPSSAVSGTAILYTKRELMHWDFEDTLVDSISGFTGMYRDVDGELDSSANFVTDEDSLTGAAFSFPGDGKFIEILNSSEYINLYRNGYTLNCWVKLEDVGGWRGVLNCEDRTSGNGFVMNVSPDGNVQQILMISGAGWTYVYSPDVVDDGQWHMISSSFDAETGDMAVYVDGVATSRSSINVPTKATSTAILLGATKIDGESSITGLIDEMSVWSYPMTEYEIADIYLELKGGSVCIESERPSGVVDINNDCIVDLKDFSEFAQSWLMTGIYTIEE